MVQPVTRHIVCEHLLTDALDVFLLDRQVRHLTDATLDFYRKQTRAFIRWCEPQGVTGVAAVTATVIRRYFAHLLSRNLADRSVHAAWRALHAFFNFCVAEELINESPMRRVSVPKVNKGILPAFGTDDVERLLAACASSRERAVVLTLLDSGLRASEFVALNGGDVNVKDGTVHVRQGKGRKGRFAYLGNKSRRGLLRYYMDRGGAPRDDQPVWIAEGSGERLTDSGLRQVLQRIGKRANVEHCHPHTFRRTFALWSLRAGMSVYHLQRLMGHEDLAMLRQYLALVDEDLQAAHAKFGAVDVGLR